MSQSPYPAEISPDPFDRFPVYSPEPETAAEPAQLPVPFVPPAPVAVPPGSPYPVMTTAQGVMLPYSDQQPVSTPVLVVSWVVAVVTGFYMLPWAIAVTRGKSNQWAIFAGNLLLGWTLVGWIVALVKACGAHNLAYPVQQYLAITAAPAPAPAPEPTPTGPPPGWYPMADGSGSRYWDGQAWGATVQR